MISERLNAEIDDKASPVFQRVTLKNWEWPGYEATTKHQSKKAKIYGFITRKELM